MDWTHGNAEAFVIGSRDSRGRRESRGAVRDGVVGANVLPAGLGENRC